MPNGGDIAFSCDSCIWASLPFNLVDNDGVDVAAASSSNNGDVEDLVAPSSPNQVNYSVSSFPDILSRKGLHILHANVRSLSSKLSKIRSLLTRTRTSIFAATETWLDSTIGDGEIAVPGFNVIRRDRDRNGGGVALFVKSNLSFNPRPDLSIDHAESLWVEILLPKTKGILVGVF